MVSTTIKETPKTKEEDRMAKAQQSHELNTNYTDDEIEVAEILLHLPEQIVQRESGFRWGFKKKRSAGNNKNQPSPAVVPPPPEPSSSPQAERERPSAKVAVTSPTTPLSFSPSESDEKRKPLTKRKLQKRKEEWLEVIRDLTERRDLLKKEVENVSRYYDKLKAFNLELKARKEELITTGLKKEKLDSNLGQSLNYVTELGSSSFPGLHHTPFITDQTVAEIGISKNLPFLASHIPSSLSNSGFSNNSNNVSRLIPDLNVSLEESSSGVESFQPFDFAMANKNLSRVIAGEARRRRLQIYRGKTSNGANKQRYPC